MGLRKQMADIIDGSFDNHVMEEVHDVRSFRFTNVRLKRSMDIVSPGRTIEKLQMERTSAYSFGLTWRPGHIVLTGDLGELTLVHYHALPTFKDIVWALSPDHGYLMSKTNVRQEYDQKAQLRELRQWANEEAVEYLNGHVSTNWRHPRAHDNRATQGPFQKIIKRVKGFRHELQEWRRECKAAGWSTAGRPMHFQHEDDIPEKPTLEPITKRPYDKYPLLSANRYDHKVEEHYVIPDHWKRWARLWYEADFGEIESILTPRGRREILDTIENEHLQSADGAANLFYGRLGFDDFSSAERWPDRTYWQIAAIQHGINMIVLKEFPDSTAAQRIREGEK
jgi:hypothetical protein